MNTNEFHAKSDDGLMEEKPDVPRDVVRFADISGVGDGNRPKAHVMLRYYEQYSDGSIVDLQMLSVDKPIVHVFSHAGYVNVHLDFSRRDDMDLRMFWELLTEYSRPQNSVSYLPEEISKGYYDAGDGLGERMVYFPVISLILSPIGKETEYQIQGFNPAFFTLGPRELTSEPAVLQFTFPEEWFFVANDLEQVDLARVHQEVMEELAMEMNLS